MSACVPEIVSVVDPFAPALIVAAPLSVTDATPFVTVTRTVERLPFGSATLSAFPVAVLKTSAPGPEFCVAGIELTGAMFVLLTVIDAVSVAVENAVVPPLLVVSAVEPAVPLVWSHARNVIPLDTVPVYDVFGRK